MEITLKILDSNHQTIAEKKGLKEITLCYSGEYREGDRIQIKSAEKYIHIWLQIDDALGKSLVYLTDVNIYMIPFGEKRLNLSPKAFCGNRHLLYARVLYDTLLSV